MDKSKKTKRGDGRRSTKKNKGTDKYKKFGKYSTKHLRVSSNKNTGDKTSQRKT